MSEKPLFAFDYKRENVELVRQTGLYVATKLGDLIDDLVVIGGLVPSLLIPDESLPAGEDVHSRTRLSLTLPRPQEFRNRSRSSATSRIAKFRERRLGPKDAIYGWARTNALVNGAKIEVIQKSVGHEKINTTQMYDKRLVNHRESASFAVRW